MPSQLSLRPHQVQTSQYILDNQYVLVDADMGTGKTAAAMAAMRASDAESFLVVCPLRVINTWLQEFEKWGWTETDITFVPLTQKSTKKRAEAVEKAPTRAVILAPYSGYWREPLYSRLRHWAKKSVSFIVYDEVHNIKAAGSKVSKRAHTWHKDFKYRVGLTGTMINNGKQDIYGQGRAIMPQAFGTSYQRFRSRYLIMGGYENRQVIGYTNEDDYKKMLDSFVLAVDANVPLPPTTETDIIVDMGPKTYRLYKELAKEYVAETGTGIISAANAMVKSTRLRQMASGIYKEDNAEAYVGDNAKVDAASVWCDSARGKLAVIWVNFVPLAHSVYGRLVKDGHLVSRVFGGINEYEQWVNGETKILMMSLSAGAEGLNDLVKANYVLYLPPVYSNVQYRQSYKRNKREGAKGTVHFTRLISKGTLEPKIYKALESKQDIATAVHESVGNRYAS